MVSDNLLNFHLLGFSRENRLFLDFYNEIEHEGHWIATTSNNLVRLQVI